MIKKHKHQARTVALQTLYQLDIQRLPADADVAPLISPLLAETDLPADMAAYARRLAAGTWTAREHYDAMISSVSNHWDVARMAVVDRNVLRLSLYELIEQPDVPIRVAIDEAIELGREFGAAETPQFINGVLDAVWKQHETCRSARAGQEPAVGGGGEKPGVRSQQPEVRSEK
ncbi:MAG: transcription antitermination factor NusB [Planctomycetes bacterium]|nr:transcription antitermination factor NusB [Planctomycetota bacterium]